MAITICLSLGVLVFLYGLFSLAGCSAKKESYWSSIVLLFLAMLLFSAASDHMLAKTKGTLLEDGYKLADGTREDDWAANYDLPVDKVYRTLTQTHVQRGIVAIVEDLDGKMTAIFVGSAVPGNKLPSLFIRREVENGGAPFYMPITKVEEEGMSLPLAGSTSR